MDRVATAVSPLGAGDLVGGTVVSMTVVRTGGEGDWPSEVVEVSTVEIMDAEEVGGVLGVVDMTSDEVVDC